MLYTNYAKNTPKTITLCALKTTCSKTSLGGIGD